MTQAFRKSEAIILKTTPYAEKDQILTLFSLEEGIIKLFYKGSYRPQNQQLSILQPLNLVEAVYQEKKSDLFGCNELQLIYSYPNLRNEYFSLQAACSMLKAIEVSQLPGKSATRLYQLLCFYLQKLPQAADPLTISSSFFLKLLLHEGLLLFPLSCCHCAEQLISDAFSMHDQWFCQNHKNLSAIEWTEEDLQLVEILTIAPQFSTISTYCLSSQLQEKIETYFYNHFRR